jgi:hypothetical protein
MVALTYQVPQWETSLERRGLNCVGEKNNLNVSIFGTKVQGVNFVQIESSLYYWKALKAWISKMNLRFLLKMWMNGYGEKKGWGIKLSIWFSTIKT